MSRNERTEIDWKCDLCQRLVAENYGAQPQGWLRINGKDICDECVGQVLEKKNAYCH